MPISFLLYSIDVKTVDIGDCDVSFKGGITNPRVHFRRKLRLLLFRGSAVLTSFGVFLFK